MEMPLNDYLKIASVLAKISRYVDGRNWRGLRTLFTDKVETDYTSLFGGEVQTQKSDDLIANWNKLLTPLDATQHLLGPADIEFKDGTAAAYCHVRGYHFLQRAKGGTEWMVAGQYQFELVQGKDEWKIQKMKLNTFYQTGNQKLLEEAANSSKA